MIKHVTLINFREGTTDSQRAAVLNAFQNLPAHIPGVTEFSVGLDLGLLEGNASLAVFASFASEADFLAYSTHPAHAEIVFPVCDPVMAGHSGRVCLAQPCRGLPSWTRGRLPTIKTSMS